MMMMMTSLSVSAEQRPCDIFASFGTPCVAAHSVVRSLFAAYDGPLYQVVRTTDMKSINVSTLVPGGYANGPAQTAFCSRGDATHVEHGASQWPWAPGPCCDAAKSCPDACDRKSPGACPSDPGCVGCANCGPSTPRAPTLAKCMITRIFDQSGNNNHLHGLFHEPCPQSYSHPHSQATTPYPTRPSHAMHTLQRFITQSQFIMRANSKLMSTFHSHSFLNTSHHHSQTTPCHATQ